MEKYLRDLVCICFDNIVIPSFILINMYVTELFIDLKSSKKSFLPVLLALDESGIYQKIL